MANRSIVYFVLLGMTMPLFVSSCFGESDEVSLGSVKLESSVKSMVTVAEGGGATAITSINSVYGIAGSGSVSQSVTKHLAMVKFLA